MHFAFRILIPHNATTIGSARHEREHSSHHDHDNNRRRKNTPLRTITKSCEKSKRASCVTLTKHTKFGPYLVFVVGPISLRWTALPHNDITAPHL